MLVEIIILHNNKQLVVLFPLFTITQHKLGARNSSMDLLHQLTTLITSQAVKFVYLSQHYKECCKHFITQSLNTANTNA